LSLFDKSPEGLKEAFICGGLPPLVDNPDPVYARTYGRRFATVIVGILID
jgi:hypothetical protein